MSSDATLNYATAKPAEPGLAETLISNAITYAWFQARGGFRSHLVMTGLVATGLTFLIGLTTSLGPASSHQGVLTFWAMALLVLQSSTIVLIGGLGIVNAIRHDANSGMHDSMRLMRISPTRVVLGYLTGASTQALNVFIPCSIAGAICSGISGVGIGPWLWGAMLLLSTAITLLFVAAFMGMMFRQAAVFVVLCAIFGPMLTSLLPVVPGMLMLAGPAAGHGALAARSQNISPIVLLSIVSQGMLAALFFFSAAHRFRYPAAAAFGIRRGTLLLAAWALISTLGMVFWKDLYPRWMMGNRIDEFTAVQIVGTLIPALLISLVPALAAARQWVDWRRSIHLNYAASRELNPPRREPGLFALLLAITSLIVAPALLASSFVPNINDLLLSIALCALATLAFHVSIAAIARRLQISVARFATALTVLAFLALILMPLIAEWTLFIILDERPMMVPGGLSQFSPIGVYLAAGWDKPDAFESYSRPFIGVLAQLILAIGLFFGLRLPRATALPGFDITTAPPFPPPAPSAAPSAAPSTDA